MKHVFISVAALFLAAGCNCGGEEVNGDGGTDAGTLPSGKTDAGGTTNDGGTNPDGGGNPDSGTDGGGIPGQLAFNEWCPSVETGYRNVILQREQSCGQSGIMASELERLGYVSGFPTNALQLSVVNCTGLGAHLGAMTGLFEGSIAAGRMQYDAQKAYQCRQLGRDTSADGGALEMRDPDGYIVEPCRGVLVGLVQQGAACDFHEECADGLYCKSSANNACGGVCQSRLAINAPCSPVRDLCVLDATCADPAQSGTFTCIERGNVGDACQDAADCKAGLKCSDMVGCLVPGAEGTACSTPAANSDECEDGLHCIGTSGAATCQPPAAAGEACGSVASGGRPCDSCLKCASTGMCEAAVVGSACTLDSECPSNSYCASGTCALKPRENEACVVAADATGTLPQTAEPGNCLYGDTFCKRVVGTDAAGTCAAFPVLTQTCGDRYDAADCAEGYCDFSGGSPIGVCKEHLGAGSGCPQGDECGEGLFCDAATTTCQPLPVGEQACTPNDACADGFFCDDTNVCKPERAAGATCTKNAECGSGSCDPSTGTCVAPCNQNYDPQSCGCPTGGAKDYSVFLLFAIVLLPRVSRRRGA